MDSGFECMNVFYCCVYNEIQYLYISAIQYNNIKNKIKSSDQLLWPTASMLINKVSDDACQWNGHDVVISIGGIFSYRTLWQQ